MHCYFAQANTATFPYNFVSPEKIPRLVSVESTMIDGEERYGGKMSLAICNHLLELKGAFPH